MIATIMVDQVANETLRSSAPAASDLGAQDAGGRIGPPAGFRGRRKCTEERIAGGSGGAGAACGGAPTARPSPGRWGTL